MRIVATAGHVDHGKSTLVRALTGTEPDRLAEERRRGVSIELGFAHTTLPSGAGVSFVDVPGHARYLPNMLAGVGAVDACMFVVAATEGWRAQSEEHLRILEIVGIRHGIVALTMCDLVDDVRLAEVTSEVESRVAATFLAGTPIVAVAAPAGLGLDRLRAALDDLAASTPGAPDVDRPRLWVDRHFTAAGAGTVVTGTLTSGTLHRGDAVVVVPDRRTARVRAIQSLGADVASIGPGNRVALNLSGIGRDAVRRGDAVVRPDRWHLTARFDASLAVLGTVGHDVAGRGAYVAYIGARDVPARVRVVGGDAIAPGNRGLVRVTMPVELPLVPGDRYVLRESGRGETIGGGEILDVDPVVRASRASPDRRIERVVAERGWVDAAQLELLTGHRIDPTIGRWVVDPVVLERVRADLVARVSEAGAEGLDAAALGERERVVLAGITEVVVENGRVRSAGRADPFADHPVAARVRAGGFAPEQPAAADRDAVRALIGRGVLVGRDGVLFHADTVDAAALVAAELIATRGAGFTVSEFRERTGSTRKYALPLLAELDARGVTRRRDDVRIAGPRIPRLPTV